MLMQLACSLSGNFLIFISALRSGYDQLLPGQPFVQQSKSAWLASVASGASFGRFLTTAPVQAREQSDPDLFSFSGRFGSSACVCCHDTFELFASA